MSECDQTSVISYHASVKSTSSSDNEVVAISGIDSILNAAGMFTKNLTDYAIFNINSDTISFRVSVEIDTPDSTNSAFADSFTIALLGCAQPQDASDSLIHRDVVLSCELATTDWFDGDPESQSSVKVFNQLLYNFADEQQSIISGGAFNIIHQGFTALSISTGAQRRDAVFTISGLTGSSLNVGNFFFGRDLPIQIDPNTFNWRARIVNDRQLSRSLSTFSSNGVLLRSTAVDIINVPLNRLYGQLVALAPDPEDDITNWMRVIMANTGQPILFNPYPKPIIDGGSATTDTDLLLSLRQNFFSIYGFAAQDMNFGIGDSKEGLNSTYTMRMEFTETR